MQTYYIPSFYGFHGILIAIIKNPMISTIPRAVNKGTTSILIPFVSIYYTLFVLACQGLTPQFL
ncbi:hypothetical protein LCGC14_1117350 [marine sediment metagenome]|uniref:Uncharacterized protein n=1 Tax=marine sediment metagenome TaxID=412755 RepID=A0A0F9QAS5_9ZZZZ